MKIVSFARPGDGWDCGWLDAAGWVHSTREVIPGGPWRRLCGLLRMSAKRRNELGRTAPRVVRWEKVKAMPPVPLPPAIWANHGNAPMVWKFQEARERRWQLPRLPYFRVRSLNSLGGPGQSIAVAEGLNFVHGVELACVIGRPGRNIPENEARRHIAGWTLLNDGFMGGMEKITGGGPSPAMQGIEKQSSDTLAKCFDGVTLAGPWIVPDGELADPYDLLLATTAAGKQQKRGWTGSYLLTAEYLVAFLSRFGRLETGTLISLGAAGWDGCRVPLGKRKGASVTVAVAGEGFASLCARVRRVGRLGATVPPTLAAAGEPVRSIWMMPWHLPPHVSRRGTKSRSCPLLHPRSVEQEESGTSMAIPPAAGECRLTLRCAWRASCRVGRGRWQGLALPGTLEVFLQIQDCGVAGSLSCPTAYEQRAASFMGSCHSATLLRLGCWTAAGSKRVPVSLRAGRDALEGGLRPAAVAAELDRMGWRINLAATLFPGDLLAGSPLLHPLPLPDTARYPLSLRWRVGGMDGEILLHDAREEAARDHEQR